MQFKILNHQFPLYIGHMTCALVKCNGAAASPVSCWSSLTILLSRCRLSPQDDRRHFAIEFALYS